MTFDSVSQDFAFGSGATKSPRIQGRDSFLTPQFDFLLLCWLDLGVDFFLAGVLVLVAGLDAQHPLPQR